MTLSSSQRILAVDPGMQYLGIALLEGEDLIWYGIKTFSSHDARPQIKQYLTSLFQKYRPTMLVVEEPFYAQSLLRAPNKTGEGAAMLLSLAPMLWRMQPRKHRLTRHSGYDLS